MKFTKKKVFVAALAVCLIAILSMGSLAWFNANDEVTNIFNVADSEGPNDSPEFSIKVEETKNDGTTGTTKTNTYNDVLPGQKIAKDPKITNTSTESDQFVRVNVIISKAFADQIAEAQGKFDANGDVAPEQLDFSKLFDGFDATKYEDTREFNTTALADYYIYAYYLKNKLAINTPHTVFTNVNIPGNFVQSDMAFGQFGINVKAEALQTKYIKGTDGNDVTTASAAFSAVGWETGSNYDYPASN